MNIRPTITVIVLLFILPNALGQNPKPDISHGNGLLQTCTSDSDVDRMVCFGYIQGVYDALVDSGESKDVFLPTRRDSDNGTNDGCREKVFA